MTVEPLKSRPLKVEPGHQGEEIVLVPFWHESPDRWPSPREHTLFTGIGLPTFSVKLYYEKDGKVTTRQYERQDVILSVSLFSESGLDMRTMGADPDRWKRQMLAHTLANVGGLNNDGHGVARWPERDGSRGVVIKHRRQLGKEEVQNEGKYTLCVRCEEAPEQVFVRELISTALEQRRVLDVKQLKLNVEWLENYAPKPLSSLDEMDAAESNATLSPAASAAIGRHIGTGQTIFVHKPLSGFKVRVLLPDGRPYPYNGELWLRVTIIDHKGEPRLRCADGTDLVQQLAPEQLEALGTTRGRTKTVVAARRRGKHAAAAAAGSGAQSADATKSADPLLACVHDGVASWDAGLCIREAGSYRICIKPAEPPMSVRHADRAAESIEHVDNTKVCIEGRPNPKQAFEGVETVRKPSAGAGVDLRAEQLSKFLTYQLSVKEVVIAFDEVWHPPPAPHQHSGRSVVAEAHTHPVRGTETTSFAVRLVRGNGDVYDGTLGGSADLAPQLRATLVEKNWKAPDGSGFSEIQGVDPVFAPLEKGYAYFENLMLPVKVGGEVRVRVEMADDLPDGYKTITPVYSPAFQVFDQSLLCMLRCLYKNSGSRGAEHAAHAIEALHHGSSIIQQPGKWPPPPDFSNEDIAKAHAAAAKALNAPSHQIVVSEISVSAAHQLQLLATEIEMNAANAGLSGYSGGRSVSSASTTATPETRSSRSKRPSGPRRQRTVSFQNAMSSINEMSSSCASSSLRVDLDESRRISMSRSRSGSKLWGTARANSSKIREALGRATHSSSRSFRSNTREEAMPAPVQTTVVARARPVPEPENSPGTKMAGFFAGKKSPKPKEDGSHLPGLRPDFSTQMSDTL